MMGTLTLDAPVSKEAAEAEFDRWSWKWFLSPPRDLWDPLFDAEPESRGDGWFMELMEGFPAPPMLDWMDLVVDAPPESRSDRRLKESVGA